MRRDSGSQIIRAGKCRATSQAGTRIRKAIDSGYLTTSVIVIGASTRLDHIAWQVYGDSSMWWVIAAASGIGWGMQIPAGTRVVVPKDKERIGLVVS